MAEGVPAGDDAEQAGIVGPAGASTVRPRRHCQRRQLPTMGIVPIEPGLDGVAETALWTLWFRSWRA